MEIDGQLDESSRRLFRFPANGQFRIDRVPLGCNPGFVNSEKGFTLVFEMLIKGAGRVSGLLRDSIRIGSMIADTIEDLGRGRHEARARLLGRSAPGTVGLDPFLPGAGHNDVENLDTLTC